MRTLLFALLFTAAGLARAGDVVLCLEAESATEVKAPLRVINASADLHKGQMPVAAGASGNRYLEIAQGQGNPPKVTTASATITFTLPEAGKYMMWSRVWWLDECANSFGVEINGMRAFTFGQDATYKTWHWLKSPVRLKQLDLKAGTHTMVLKNREDGIRIDQILLTNDRRFVPVGVEKVTAVP